MSFEEYLIEDNTATKSEAKYEQEDSRIKSEYQPIYHQGNMIGEFSLLHSGIESRRLIDLGNQSIRHRNRAFGKEKNFNCGCSRKYQSYAALYTHAKLKHNGVFPEGTVTVPRKRLGRPRVILLIIIRDQIFYMKASWLIHFRISLRLRSLVITFENFKHS